MSTGTEGARKRFRVTRDGILFVTGLAGIIYETVVNRGDNTMLLIVFSAMCGLPAFLRGDEFIHRRVEKDLEGPAKKAAEPEETP